MATYLELKTLVKDSDLQDRVEIAVAVAADAVRSEVTTTPNHVRRLEWASTAFRDAKRIMPEAMLVVLAANKALTVAQITGASDTALQAAVDAAVNVLAEKVRL